MSPHVLMPPARSLLDSRYRESASRRLRLAATVGAVVFLHVLALALLGIGALDRSVGSLAIGALITAYLAGLRHAADCDHITGIDNATRKFVGEGRHPTSVGLAFSLGHSTVVFLLAMAIVLGSGLARATVTDGAPSAMRTIGGLVAGGFLVLIGSFNSVSLYGALQSRGASCVVSSPTLAGRLMAKPLARIRHPRHMFVLGFLFGLGFDTATLIGFLVLTAATATSGVGIAGVLALPVAFAAGMTLADTVDGMLMLRMYSSAAAADRRRFNVIVTGMSVVSAFVVGGIILVNTAQSAFGLSDPVIRAIASVDLEYAGFALVGVFVAMWVAFAVQRRLAANRGE